MIEARVLHEIWLGEDGKPKSLKPPFQFGSPRPWGFDPYIGAYYDVQILKVFKGRPATQLRLFSENSTARFWLTMGTDYLLFISTEPFDPPIGQALTIDTCGNSALVSKAAAALRIVKGLTKSK